mgnify:CR=1 FL=1
MAEIIAHDWRLGQAHFKVRWSGGDTSWEHLKDMHEDYPRLTAQYIVGNKVSRSNRGGDQVFQWARKVVRDLDPQSGGLFSYTICIWTIMTKSVWHGERRKVQGRERNFHWLQFINMALRFQGTHIMPRILTIQTAIRIGKMPPKRK